MIGAIIGDIVGSRFEHFSQKPADFELLHRNCSFTDDSVLTIAIANALLELDNESSYAKSKLFYRSQLRSWAGRYPDAGYGQSFLDWTRSENQRPYGSYGNGSAMRVSPIGYAFDSLEKVLKEAGKSASVTHNHPDGIRGAKAAAGAVFLALRGFSKEDIRNFIEKKIGYSVSFDLGQLHENYGFEIQCKHSVPQAIFAFLESSDFESAIRNAIYIGGDSDTIACIAGSVAGAFYREMPAALTEGVKAYLPREFKDIIERFNTRFR